MKNKTTIITTILCILPILLGVLLYDKLPDTIAVHFDARGEGDGFMPKAVAVFGLPLIFAAVNIYSHFRVYSDPMKSNISSMSKKILQWISPITAMVVIPATLFLASGASLPIILIIESIFAILVIAVGNYFPKCKKNYTIGIKTPWTLNSEDNWFQTHRLAGFLWTLGGFLLFLNAIFSISTYIIIFTAISLIIIPYIYSYSLSLKDTKNL